MIWLEMTKVMVNGNEDTIKCLTNSTSYPENSSRFSLEYKNDSINWVKINEMLASKDRTHNFFSEFKFIAKAEFDHKEIRCSFRYLNRMPIPSSPNTLNIACMDNFSTVIIVEYYGFCFIDKFFQKPIIGKEKEVQYACIESNKLVFLRGW